jgi:tRNA(Ile)-lysidine synthase
MYTPPPVRTDIFHAGQRVTVAVSGGADSVALLRRLLEECNRIGIVLSVAHVHHGMRGDEADADAAFVAGLAAQFDLPFYLHRVDVPARAAAAGETLEEAARRLRYSFFESLVAQGHTQAIATGHTLDDQAETVLHRFLRGAWTEGLSGIYPVVTLRQGRILRPFLETPRAQIEAWLGEIGQSWREDLSNRDPAFTRNRIRHELLPLLKSFNPEIARQLSRLAAMAADEEHYWEQELHRLLPSLLLPGKPVRGGGRASSTHPGETTVAIERVHLQQLHPAAARRVLREAARQLGVRLSFDHTHRLLALSNPAERSHTSKLQMPGGLVAERSLREIRLTRKTGQDTHPAAVQEYGFSIPGEISATELEVFLRAELAHGQDSLAPRCAILRTWRAGDRVRLRHARSAKKVKEVLDILRVTGEERERWPVVEVEGRIVWMRGVEVEAPEFLFQPQPGRQDDEGA